MFRSPFGERLFSEIVYVMRTDQLVNKYLASLHILAWCRIQIQTPTLRCSFEITANVNHLQFGNNFALHKLVFHDLI